MRELDESPMKAAKMMSLYSFQSGNEAANDGFLYAKIYLADIVLNRKLTLVH